MCDYALIFQVEENRIEHKDLVQHLPCLPPLFFSFIILGDCAHWTEYIALNNTSDGASFFSDDVDMNHFVAESQRMKIVLILLGIVQLAVFLFMMEEIYCIAWMPRKRKSCLFYHRECVICQTVLVSLNVGCPFYAHLCRGAVWTHGQLLEVHVFLGSGWN